MDDIRVNVETRVSPLPGWVNKRVRVEGHWLGDFEGTLAEAGRALAIVRNGEGVAREVCYLRGVTFTFLERSML